MDKKLEKVRSRYGKNVNLIWSDRKRYFGMPISFTRYYLIENPGEWMKIYENVGLLASMETETNVFRIFDLEMHQTLSDKIFGVGTITLHVSDESNPIVYLRRVKNPYKVRNLIASKIEDEREKKGFRLSEIR